MGDLQSTNRVALGKVRETTFGVIPANPVFKQILQTSSGIKATPKTKTSNVIDPSRQVRDLILVGIDAGGAIGGELAFNGADDDFEEALQGTWSNNPAITVATIDTEISDVSATALTVAAGGAAFVVGALTLLQNMPTASNNKLARVTASTAVSITYPAATFTAETAPIPVGASVRTVGFEGAAGDVTAVTAGGNGLSSTVLDFTTLGISVGEWVKLGDADNAGHSFTGTAANNDWCRVSAIAAHKLSFDRVPAGWAADAAAGVTLRVFTGDILFNGSTKRSNTIERQYLDHAPVTYEYLRGMTINTLQVDLNTQDVVTYTKNYLGRDAYLPAPMVRATGATDLPASTFDVLNTSSNIGRIGFDGSPIAGPNFVLKASFTINDNLRAQNAIGSVGAVGTGNGDCLVTGTLQTYFGDPSIYQKIINNTRTSFDTRVGRADGNRESMLFDFPSIKLSDGAPSVSGKNADVILDGQFTATRHPTLGYTMSVGRFWYLPTS
ncbi:phage tail tube protein [Bradyrhizobium elkanii]|uniref:phage tail tube protein n=1 Tax=Bradyrhizobium elkanii TaxID=29448 RepID=UPI000841A031|nr:phage tail tube protein [Bradyrhizobium elkanii]ODM77795.1 hypothetical protein A6452_34535 [Bradyrhizobium elkanii]ODM81749.1 hypothetical protein A6X20_18980 [Bradyrhizobium elkanii]